MAAGRDHSGPHGGARGPDAPFTHELVLSESAEDTHAAAVRVVRDARSVGDPVALSMPRGHAAAVLDVVGSGRDVTVVAVEQARRRPATELRTLIALADELVDRERNPGSRLRLVNELPAAGSSWRKWCRYEAAANVGLADTPLAGCCVYDASTLPVAALDFLRRAHPVVRDDTAGFLTENDAFDPVAVGWATFDSPSDPLELNPPVVEVVDPSLAAGRAAVRGFTRNAGLPPEDLEALVFAAHEALANALEHGRPPVRLTVWARPGRALVRVDDTGPGPADCFPDIVQTGRLPGGMWLSGQLVDVTHARSEAGYSVRLSLGEAPDRAPGVPLTRREDA